MNPGAINVRARTQIAQDRAGHSPTLTSAVRVRCRRDGSQKSNAEKLRVKRAFDKARRHQVKLARQIQRSAKDGNSRKLREALRRYLASNDCILIAAENANRKVPKSRRLDGDALLELATGFNPFSEELEPVYLFYKRRNGRGGGRRGITRFGLHHKIRQCLCANALKNTYEPKSCQYSVKDRGREAAVLAVVKGLRQGAKWFVERDISNFHQSVGMTDGAQDAVRHLTNWLLLPEEIVAHCITGVSYSLSGHIHMATCSDVSLRVASRRGIPTGSISSEVIADICIRDIISDFEASPYFANVNVVNYSDNFGVVAIRKSDVEGLMLPMERAVARCSHGSLRLKPRPKPIGVWRGFEFLGYWIRCKHGKVEILPAEYNLEAFEAKCREHLRRIKRNAQNDIGPLRQYVLSWCASFRLAGYIHRTIARKLRSLTVKHAPDIEALISDLYRELWYMSP